MSTNFKCEICLDTFDDQRICPRVCVSCGHSICDKCLIDIRYRQEVLKCPFCKHTSKEIWPKNITIIHMIEAHTSSLLCDKHQRPAISLCASKECRLPVTICDLAECSRIHKQKGTNTIPLVLLGINSSAQKERESSLNVVQLFYGAVEKEISKLLKDRKINSKVFGVEDKVVFSKFKQDTNQIITSIANCELGEVTSEKLAAVKEEILDQQEDDECDLASKNEEVVKLEMKNLIDAISDIISNLKVDYIPKEFYEEPSKPVSIKPSPIFDIVRKKVQSKFTPYLIFDSTSHSDLVFRSRIGGQSNLVFYVELQDGTSFGAYFKRSFSKYFHEDRNVVDFDSFVFEVSSQRVFKSTTNAISNYNVGPEYFIAVGNTNNWDGFWFKGSFKEINSDSTKGSIKSSQFETLEIPLKTKAVRLFQTYQLDME